MASGSFCGIDCRDGGVTCPDGSECKDAGSGTLQCMPSSGDCACTSHAGKVCHDGSIVWTSSCNELEDVAEDCGGRGCIAAGCCLAGTHADGDACVSDRADGADGSEPSDEPGVEVAPEAVEVAPDALEDVGAEPVPETVAEPVPDQTAEATGDEGPELARDVPEETSDDEHEGVVGVDVEGTDLTIRAGGHGGCSANGTSAPGWGYASILLLAVAGLVARRRRTGTQRPTR